MHKRLFDYPILPIIVLGGILLSVFVCVFPNVLPSLSWVVNYAVQLMLFYLLAGLVALVFKQPKLTFAFFGGCALLCFFMKYSVNGNGIERWRQQMIQSHRSDGTSIPVYIPDLKIANINLTNANNRSEVFSMVQATNADIVFFHEVTYNWVQMLQDSLSDARPFNHTMVDLGIYGMAIYSKYEIAALDTFYFNQAPNLKGRILVNGQPFSFISVHTQPSLDEFSKKKLVEHLSMVEKQVVRTDDPILVVGDFNAVSWSDLIQVFMNHTGLIESRTGFMPTSFSGTISIWNLPLDHIFYSGEFICSNFQNLVGDEGQHLGILGTYQLIRRTNHAKKTAQ